MIVTVAFMASRRVYAEPMPEHVEELPPVQGQVETRAPIEGQVEAHPPLEGTAEARAPLEGAVEARPPLQGGVERKVAPESLKPGVGKFAQEPLRGAADQTSLRGAVDQSNKLPLQGSVVDSRHAPLQGSVKDQGASLGALTPNYSAVMKIVQFKKRDAIPQVTLPPISREEIERARFRDDVNLSKVPLRSEDISDPRPLRAKTAGEPGRHTLSDGRPQRSASSVPQRPDSAPPSRTLISVDAPPIRSVGGWLTPPSRELLDDQAPTSRVELNPERLSVRSNDGANVRPAPDANARLLQPTPIADMRSEPQRAIPKGFQEPPKKKKRDKKTNLDLTPKGGLQAIPELAASADESLLWDRWYQHVNDLVCAALRTTMPKHGNPAGTNRVHITVWADHRIEPRLVEGTNQNFDQAIIEAYKSLNGSAELQFPGGTHRKQNDYDTAHSQEIPAATAAFESSTVRGDLETLVK
ncbi:MAG: hypothetical protein HYX67_01530 [Candidatus Melainabacteria bacterium]|nr:hypothetical protein [Candidatus Melainabacteria bacterium]